MGRPRRQRLQRALGAALRPLLAAGLVAGAAAAADDDGGLTIYQWTDSRGIYRYTPELDRIPSNARDTVVTIQTGEGPPSNAPIYFDPDPRSKVVEVPEPLPASATPGPPIVTDDSYEYDDRIRELQARIAADEEALKGMISGPEAPGPVEVPPELREIAERLPRLQAELASLLRGRARAAQP
jgi:hypothetical protein